MPSGLPDAAPSGDAIYALATELYPICRSITGDGVRETLQILGRAVDLQISEVPTGTPVFDWTVPREWRIRNAYIKNEAGQRVVDFHAHSLHVLNYSLPVHRIMPLSELTRHIHTLPSQPYSLSHLQLRGELGILHGTQPAHGAARWPV